MMSQEQQILEQIKKSSNILIVMPAKADGDMLASSLALFLFLKKLGKKAEVFSENVLAQKNLAFLPDFSAIRQNISGMQKFIISLNTQATKVEQVKYVSEGDKLNFIIIPKNGFFTPSDITSFSGEFKFDLIITVGAQDLDSLGKVYENNTEFFYKTPLINIDNQSGNLEFGQINYINLMAISTTEIIFSLARSEAENMIDEDIATCLLAGMIIKTKSFKTPTITPQSLETAAKLIALGARREQIMNELYRSRSLNVLKIWGRALARLSSSQGGTLMWSALSQTDFTKTDAAKEDLPEVVDELIGNIPQARIIVLFYETMDSGKQATGALVHAKKNIDLLKLLSEYDPSANGNLLYISSELPLAEATKKIITALEDYLKKMPA